MTSGEVVRAVWVLTEERRGRILVNLLSEARMRAEPREGFAIPAVIFALVVMSMLAMVSLITARDEQLSSRAMHESAGAFYAAEAGYNQLLATWNDSLTNTLQPGDSLLLGWQSLEGGARYRGVISRYDNGGGGQKMFALTVEGRGAGPAGGQRVVSVGLTPGGGVSLNLDGAFVLNSTFNVGKGGGVVVDGNDNIPPGWGGVCDAPGPAQPGIVTDDPSTVNEEGSPTITGDPPIQVAPFDTAAFDALFDQLVAMADITFPPGVQPKDGTHQILPVENPPGVCDTSMDTNWGAPEDPTHPCFDYYPIIYAPEGFDFKAQPDHAGQGILLVDETAQLENGFSWYGLIMAKGDIQIEQGKGGYQPANIYGALYTRNDNSSTKLAGPQWHDSIGGVIVKIPNGDPPIVDPHIDVPGSSLYYSSCALERLEELSSMSTGGGGSAGVKPLSSRAFGELLR